MARATEEAAIEPVRVVIEFEQAEFVKLNKACRTIAPADFLRALALERIATAPTTKSAEPGRS